MSEISTIKHCGDSLNSSCQGAMKKVQDLLTLVHGGLSQWLLVLKAGLCNLWVQRALSTRCRDIPGGKACLHFLLVDFLFGHFGKLEA